MPETEPPDETGTRPLRRGWTTGACATAAAKSAAAALFTGTFIDPVAITLPGGQKPAFVLVQQSTGPDWAEAGIIKDAGDDPDVTHGACILARVAPGRPGGGIRFFAGEGVGTVTRPGLKLAVNEPAINPVPRRMMTDELSRLCATHKRPADLHITISVPDGEAIAAKTWNPRLGILEGISILGTTGIVIPYSCSAWIHSIHGGIDVARAAGTAHIAGVTGNLSEKAAMAHLGLPEDAIIDMGDFVGGMLKYLSRHPIPLVTIAGGFAKMTKLAQGAMDLHSARSQIDPAFLAQRLERLGAPPSAIVDAQSATTAGHCLDIARAHNLPLGSDIAALARLSAMRILDTPEIKVSVLVTGRDGGIIGEAK